MDGGLSLHRGGVASSIVSSTRTLKLRFLAKPAKEGTNSGGVGGGPPFRILSQVLRVERKSRDRESEREFLQSMDTLLKKVTFLLISRGYL